MDLGIRGKVALVAASSKGLGRATALALAAEGCDVAIAARGQEALAETAAAIEALGVRAHAVAADLSTEEGCETFVAGARDALGEPQILVANAGGPPPGDATEVSDEDWLAAFSSLFLSVRRLVSLVLPGMRSAGWGRIVAIESVSVKQPVDGLALSNGIRAAVAGYAKTLAAEVARDGVTVNVVGPGPNRTGRMEQLAAARAEREGVTPADVLAAQASAIPAGRLGEPAELAAAVAFLCGAPASYITGTVLPVDGGLSRSLL